MRPTNFKEENKKARLLCVDDDLRFLVLLAEVLEKAGYSVVATNDPRKALELAISAAFDLAILDYDMPGMDGAELACRLKQCKCDFPIILFSGNPSLPARALSAADHHAVKGEGVEPLLRALSAKIQPICELQTSTWRLQ